MPALVKALGDKHPGVRTCAAWALGKIGPAARVAIPALAKALQDMRNDVRRAATEALKNIRAQDKAKIKNSKVK